MFQNEEFNQFTVAQLKAWLDALGKKSNGNKSALILRLSAIPPQERGECPIRSEGRAAAALSMPNTTDENEDDETGSNNCEDSDDDDDGFSDANERDDFAKGEEERDDGAKVVAEKNRKVKKQMIDLKQMKREMELMEREMELQRREISVLKREKECLLNYNGKTNDKKEMSNENECYTNKITMARELVSEYFGEGDNFQLWESQLKSVQRSFKLDDNNVRALIASKLKGRALKWFLSRADVATISIDCLVSDMKLLFNECTSKLAIRREFEARKWRVNETFQSYFHEKLTLANKIEFEDGELVEYIVEGIPDPGLRSQAKMHRFSHKNQLMEAFCDVSLPRQAALSKVEIEKKNRRGPMRCYNCNSLGHIAAECQKSKREVGACYVCGVLGHYAADCRENKKKDVVHLVQDEEENEFNA